MLAFGYHDTLRSLLLLLLVGREAVALQQDFDRTGAALLARQRGSAVTRTASHTPMHLLPAL